MWNNLTMSERAGVIKMAVKAGLRDMKSIRDFYDNSLKYADGGPKATLVDNDKVRMSPSGTFSDDNGNIIGDSVVLPEVFVRPTTPQTNSSSYYQQWLMRQADRGGRNMSSSDREAYDRIMNRVANQNEVKNFTGFDGTIHKHGSGALEQVSPEFDALAIGRQLYTDGILALVDKAIRDKAKNTAVGITFKQSFEPSKIRSVNGAFRNSEWSNLYDDIYLGNQTAIKGKTLSKILNDKEYNIYTHKPFPLINKDMPLGVTKTIYVPNNQVGNVGTVVQDSKGLFTLGDKVDSRVKYMQELEELVPRYNKFAEYYEYPQVPKGTSLEEAEQIIRNGLDRHNTFYRGLHMPSEEETAAIRNIIGKDATDREVLDYLAKVGSRDPYNTYLSLDERAAQYANNADVAILKRKYKLGDSPSTWIEDADFVYDTTPATGVVKKGSVNYPWASKSMIEKAPPGEVRIHPDDFTFEGWLPVKEWEYGKYVPSEYFKGSNNLYFNEAAGHHKPNFAEGGSIHIAPSKRGTFTAAATKHGMGVQEFASKVLANKDSYSSAMVKKANFAKNASKWNHGLGGYLFI